LKLWDLELFSSSEIEFGQTIVIPSAARNRSCCKTQSVRHQLKPGTFKVREGHFGNALSKKRVLSSNHSESDSFFLRIEGA
jgi:hypothetical protein